MCRVVGYESVGWKVRNICVDDLPDTILWGHGACLLSTAHISPHQPNHKKTKLASMIKCAIVMCCMGLASTMVSAATCDILAYSTCTNTMHIDGKESDGSTHKERWGPYCAAISTFAKCSTRAGCYPEYSEGGVTFSTKKSTCQSEFDRVTELSGTVQCAPTTCDSGTSISPALGLATAIFASMLKMLIA